ncbi:MAG TPA: hypothetical protein VHF90_01290 [Thermoleophilaceae bacterium]|nr:hypothetical protein [Thermoleophilaceae bacterium]
MERTRDADGFRVTERDLAMVAWIGRQRFAQAVQVARRFRMDERNTYRRLRGLVAVGLLGQRRVFHGQAGAYWATRAGLASAHLHLPPAGIDIRTYEHDRLATAVAIDLELEFGEAAVATERELRSHDAAADEPRYGIRRSMSTGRHGLHFPDLAIETADGRPLAIEVELTAKGRARLDSIINGYVRARHIAGVRYYVAPAAARGLRRAIGRAGAGELFDVRPVRSRGESR